MQGLPVAAYYRRSTDMQETSIDDQKAAVQNFARDNHMKIVREFVADAVSGRYLDDNAVFQKLIEYCTTGHPVDILLVYDESRFSRADPDETAHYRYLLKRVHVQVIYITNPGVDPLVTAVKDHMAHKYSLDLSRIVRERCKRHAISGRFNGGRPPYGYDRLLLDDRGNSVQILPPGEQKQIKTGRVVLTLGAPEKITTVRRIFSLYVDQGKGVRTIARMLNKDKIPAPNGGMWKSSSVHEIVHNPVYMGTLVWNRRSYSQRSSRGKRGAKTNDPREWSVAKNAHPAIISQEMFAAAQAKKKIDLKSIPQKPPTKYLLTGKIQCVQCGGRFWGHRRTARGRTFFYYCCSGYWTTGACPSFSIRTEILENFALEKLQEMVNLPSVRAEIRQRLHEKLELLLKDNKQERGALNRELEKTQLATQNLLKVIEESGEFEPAVVRQELIRLEREEKSLLSQKRLLDRNPPIDLAKAEEEILNYLDNMRELLNSSTPVDKQNCIREFIDRIEINPTSREATFYFYSPADVVPFGWEKPGCGGRI